MCFLGRGTVTAFLSHIHWGLRCARSSWQLLHSKHGAALSNKQVAIEILGVINNPITELRLGGEKLFLEEQQWWTAYRNIHTVLPPLSFPSSLCRAPSNRVKGASFRPVKALAVDLFPQTRHCELLILFERVDCANGSCAGATPDAAHVTTAGPDCECSDGTSPPTAPSRADPAPNGGEST